MTNYRRYPRPPRPTRDEQLQVEMLFANGSADEIARYLAIQTAAIQATWTEHDERHRRGLRHEPHIELTEIAIAANRPRKADY